LTIGVHPESLLNVPLVARLFSDDSVPLKIRAVDARWAYADIVGRRIDGFNPFQEAIFVASHSAIAEWLAHRHESARPFNHDDRLVSEVLFAVHDYLHIWGYRWIARLWPELGFGVSALDNDNFEDMVFCHLLTEAVATVGLDYWYLSCVHLNDVVAIGSARRGLTVSYRENLLGEYRNFDATFEAQSPGFLNLIARFYCSGRFPGFTASDMQLSPVLRQWLLHELEYGRLQRRYCREWFAYLSNGKVRVSGTALDRPVDRDSARHAHLIHALSERLWALVKQGDAADSGFRFDPERLWSADLARTPMFQFRNLNAVEAPSAAQIARMTPRSRTYLMHQFIGQLDYGQFPEDARPVFEFLTRKGDLSLARSLLEPFPRIQPAAAEPRDLFLYN
jgi:hypothetical protein